MPFVFSRFYLVSADGIRRIPKPSSQLLAQIASDGLEMTVFNVGPGETLLLRRGDEAVLVDGGARRKKRNTELGTSLAAHLRGAGVRLSAIVASHPHVDHLNALSTMLTSPGPPLLADPTVYFDNDVKLGSWLRETLGAALDNLGGTVDVVHVGAAGAQFVLRGDVQLGLFVDGSGKPSAKYKSVFMSAYFRQASFLFTGDAYTNYEESLMGSSWAGFLRADVLKITHHGSDGGTGDDFVRWVRPRISVASTGPDPEHRLEEAVRQRLGDDVEIFDTYTTGGDITVRTDGRWRTLNGDEGVLYQVERVRPGRLYS